MNVFGVIKKNEQEVARQYQLELARINRRIFRYILGDEMISGMPLTIADVLAVLGMGVQYANSKGAAVIYRDTEKKEGEDAKG